MEPDADKLVNREAVGQSVDGFHINLCLSSVPSGSNTALYIIHMLALLHYIYISNLIPNDDGHEFQNYII